jgi:rubrerythrin
MNVRECDFPDALATEGPRDVIMSSFTKQGGIPMTGESHDNQSESQNDQGEAVPLNWACTNCGYHVEGELPEKCPDCGEGREMFEEVPIPGY